jgi:hypothetical protein
MMTEDIAFVTAIKGVCSLARYTRSTFSFNGSDKCYILCHHCRSFTCIRSTRR